MKKLAYLLLLFVMVISCNKEDDQPSNDFNGDSGTFMDERDGQEYKWIRIGDQIWMADNFSYDSGNGCYVYNNDPQYLEKNGRLYDWETAISLCPKGWHLPTDSEFEELAVYISEQNGGYMAYGEEYITGGQEWEDVGKHLKSTTGWNENSNGTDDYGFSAFPCGYRSPTGEYSGIGKFCALWSSSEHVGYSGTVQGIGRGIRSMDNRFAWGYDQKSYARSVRYIKDSQ